MKRILSVLLALLMFAGVLSFTACSDKGAPTKPTGVFKETKIQLPDELTGSNVNFNNCLVTGNDLYILAYSYDTETYMPEYKLARFDMESSSFAEITDLDFVENSENSGINLNNFTVSDSGKVYYAVEKYSYSDEGYFSNMFVLTEENGEMKEIAVSMEDDDQYGFYVNAMHAYDDGSIVLASWDSIRLLGQDGKLTEVEFEASENYNVENMYMMDGTLYFSIYIFDGQEYGSKLYPYDNKTGKFGEPVSIKSQHTYNMLLGPGYDYYYNDRNILWGVDIESGEMTEVVNFINSDINGNDVTRIVPVNEDRFFIAGRDRVGGRNNSMLAFIDRVPEDQVVEKKILRLAVNYAGYDLRSRVIEFNKWSDTYRITIDDYSRFNTDENYSAGIDTLNSDIITGNVPDIFMITTEMPYDVYAARGVFADIYELMDADPDFNRGEYLENIFKAYEYDGQLYSLVPGFYITSFAAKKSVIGDVTGWNFDEFAEFAKAHPDMSMFDYDFDRSTFVELFMLFARDSFIESETGKCSFDGSDFRGLLEFAATLSSQSFWENVDGENQEFWTEYENRFKEDRVLLAYATISDLNYSYKNILNYQLGAEPTFVGFPVPEGNGAIIQASNEYAIAADSEFKEGAWQFLKGMIQMENQTPYYNEEYDYWEYPANGIPVLRSAVDTMVEIAMTPVETEDRVIIGSGAVTMPAVPRTAVAVSADIAVTLEDEETVELSDEVIADDSAVTEDIADVEDAADVDDTVDEELAETPEIPEVDIVYNDPYSTPLTESQVEEIMRLITGTTVAARYDNDMNNIIKEELDPFFAGQQSLDDTVKHIQNRVSIYINEKR